MCCLDVLWASQAPEAGLWVPLLSPDMHPHPHGGYISWTSTPHLVLSLTGFTFPPAPEIIQASNHIFPWEPGGHLLLLQILLPVAPAGHTAPECSPRLALCDWCVLTPHAVYVTGKQLPVLPVHCQVSCVQPSWEPSGRTSSLTEGRCGGKQEAQVQVRLFPHGVKFSDECLIAASA